jgi:flagellar P-ring protein precursor FlgI
MMRITHPASSLLLIMVASVAVGQTVPRSPSPANLQDSMPTTRIKDLVHIRGVRPNLISNIGFVIGLEGTGDTRNTPWTQQAIINLMRDYGISLDPRQINLKNIAMVYVSAELPPFARPGTRLDVTVASIGDAKSLQGGFLVPTPLYPPGNRQQAYAVAMGAVSIGGFNFGQGGTSRQKNHTNVGIVSSGAIVERGVPTEFEFDGRLFLELNEPDFTTARRIADTINATFPNLRAYAYDAAGVQVFLEGNEDPVGALSKIELLEVVPDVPATIVINERTGTIVVGGNVRVGPAMIAHGGLTVRINEYNEVVQPLPLSQGVTATQTNTEVAVKEETAQIGVLKPNATLEDLAKVFRALKLTPRDMIAIIQALKAQGAIKAIIKTQ